MNSIKILFSNLLLIFYLNVHSQITDCNQISNVDLDNNLLLAIDFEGGTNDISDNNNTIDNNNVQISSDRFDELSAGQFGDNKTLNLAHNELLKPDFPLSFSFWVKREMTGIGSNYIYTSDLQLDKRAGFAIAFGASSDQLLFFFSDENGCYNPSCRRQISSQMTFPTDIWFHIAISVRSYEDATFYVNGCEIAIDYSGQGNINLYYTEEDSYIGFADNSDLPDAQRSFFGGALDDFYFWNRSITEEEVLYLYDRFEIPELALEGVYTIPISENEISIAISEEYSDVIWSDGQTGNLATFSEEGIYQVEAFYNCHLVCAEFEVRKEEVFTPNCNQTFENTNIESNLLLHYLCNGNAINQTSNQLNGQLVNVDFTEDRFGNAGGALSFNGTNSSIILPETSILEVQYPASVSAWVYFDSEINGQGVIFDSNTSINNYRGLVVNKVGDGRLFFTFGGGEGGTSVNNRRSGFTLEKVPLKEWLHVAAVYNEIEDIDIYINGCKVEVGYSGTGAEVVSYNSDSGHIGKTTASNLDEDYFFFKGFIDDFYFWNRSITEEEVLYLYNRFNIPEFELLDSYNLCDNGEVLINIDPIFTNVIWSDGIEGNNRTLTETGTYNIEGYYDCHLICKEITVTAVPEQLQLGEDIVTCDDQVILSVPVSVEWNTGDVSNFLVITETGTYSASYQSECNFLTDTINVELLSDQSINLQDNYEICKGTSIILNIDEGYESVIWSNGTSGNSITISEAGTYQVIAEETVCPQDTHVFIVQVIDTIPDIEIDADILLCNMESITITIPDGPYQIAWNDTITDNFYTTSGNEDIILTLSNICEEDFHSISVKNVMPDTLQTINTSICNGDSIVLSGPEGAQEYIWSTLDTTKSITVREQGIYTLSYNKDGCVFDAQIAEIETQICIECEFYLPNVMSIASISGNNEFIVKSNHEECLSDIQVEIFDRWGNQVFIGSSQEPWAGFYKNRKVATGVYVVHISGLYNDSPINLFKDLTVLD